MKIQYKTPGVCVFESALFRTTTTVVQTTDLILIVDPNWLPGEVEHIRTFVERERNDRPLYLLFTHSDYDHIIGYGAFPGATVIAAQALADNPDAEKILEQIRQFDEDFYLSRQYPIEYPRVDIVVNQDGQTLEIGRTRLRFFHAPGHTRDSLFVVVEPLQVWLAGDYLCNIEFPLIEHSFREYRETLETAARLIRSLEPQLLVPGHGDVTNQRQEMQSRRREAIDYLDHLAAFVRTGDPFPEERLWQRYAFPHGMRRFHEANLARVQQELAS